MKIPLCDACKPLTRRIWRHRTTSVEATRNLQFVGYLVHRGCAMEAVPTEDTMSQDWTRGASELGVLAQRLSGSCARW